jgi:hypothetical protein
VDPSYTGTASFNFTSTEAGSTFQCKLDGGGWGGCSSPKNYTGLSAGKHTFFVRATDKAGNTDGTPASYTWTVIAILPDTNITSKPPDPSNSTSASFSFTGTLAGSTFECKLDNDAYTACSSPITYTGLGAGTHTFYVRAIDPQGITDPTPASYTWTVVPQIYTKILPLVPVWR